jgi:hypothetical protein
MVMKMDQPGGGVPFVEDDEQGTDQTDRNEARSSSGMQVISTRVPAGLVEELQAEAARQGVRPSELLRRAVEGLLSCGPVITELNPSTGNQMRVVTDLPKYATENANLVVEIPTEPAHLVALGYELLGRAPKAR